MIHALFAILLLAAAPTTSGKPLIPQLTPVDSLIRASETHFAHLWRVGRGVCPRWSADGKWLVIEAEGQLWLAGASTDDDVHPQLNWTGGVPVASSPAFLGNWPIIFSGTDSLGSLGTRWRDQKWSLAPSSHVYACPRKDTENNGKPRVLTRDPGAIESNTSPDGKKIVYTATPANDPELYVMNADGSNVRRLTADYGYDGGGCFSPDGQLICYQAYHPRLEDEKAMYADLLAKHLVDSSLLDIWIIHPDGSGRGQVTDLGATSMEPSFTPDSKRIIFSSDYQDVPGRQFDLYITKLDGGTPEKITNDPSPDCLPMFSPDGRYLAFTSGRGASTTGAQNVFIAEWK